MLWNNMHNGKSSIKLNRIENNKSMNKIVLAEKSIRNSEQKPTQDWEPERVRGEKEKASETGKRGSYMSSHSCPLKCLQPFACVCVEQVWEEEFVNACYQRGGGTGPAINTAIRGRAGLCTPIGCRQNASYYALIPNLSPSLRFPSPIITAERFSAARHRAVRAIAVTCLACLFQTRTVRASLPTWGFCVRMLLQESVNTSSAESPSL